MERGRPARKNMERGRPARIVKQKTVLRRTLTGEAPVLHISEIPTLEKRPFFQMLKYFFRVFRGRKKKSGFTLIDFIVCVIAVLVLFGVLFPALQASWNGSRVKHSCRANLQRLGEAVHVYAEQHGGYFPPRFTLDEHDKLLHSWRVLLLPHLGETELYEKITQSDTSPEVLRENFSLVLTKPSVYSCPRTLAEMRTRKDSDIYDAWEKRLTTYQVVFGPNTLLFDSQPRRLSEATSPILLAESGTGVHWLEPLDLPVSTLSQGVNHADSAIHGPGSFHSGGANVLKTDGTVIFCSKGTLRNEKEP